MKYWIYVHTCPNGKKYVGCTIRNPKDRWNKGNGYKYNKHFYNAILKYGWDNITHEAWELTSESEMYYAEKYLIAFYQTTSPRFGYNNSTGGEKGALGSHYKRKQPRSEEWRKNHSEKLKGRKRSEEARRKTSEALKGRKPVPRSEETFLKISRTLENQWRNPEYRERQSEAHRKKWQDPEYRKRMSEAHRKKI